MLGGFYGTFDWTLPQGRKVKDYVAESYGAEHAKVRRIKPAAGVKRAS